MNILRFLRSQAKDYDCTECGANHSRSEIRLLGRLDAAWIVRVTCASCRTPFKLLVVIDESAAAAVKTDHPSAARRVAVSADEVLDAHEFLRAWNGSLDEVLGTAALQTVSERSSDPS